MILSMFVYSVDHIYQKLSWSYQLNKMYSKINLPRVRDRHKFFKTIIFYHTRQHQIIYHHWFETKAWSIFCFRTLVSSWKKSIILSQNVLYTACMSSYILEYIELLFIAVSNVGWIVLSNEAPIFFFLANSISFFSSSQTCYSFTCFVFRCCMQVIQ